MNAEQILWTSDERVAQAVAEARKVARKAKRRYATVFHNIDSSRPWMWYGTNWPVVNLHRDRSMARNTWRIETE